MKQIFTLLLFAAFIFSNAQTGYQSSSRSAVNPELYPFYHGVASGDPLADRVILWTRITLDPPVDPVNVDWQIATDTGFGTIVNSGTETTDSTKDYTVKVDAGSLQPNTWYYYRFMYDTLKSVTGRTRTLPTGTVNNLRFAVASCQDYQEGYYNAHRHIAERNDIDAVLFLGDYTYEGGADLAPIGDRFHEPPSKTITLYDYRIRQSLYHLDPDLQAAHQQYPWLCVWDDHETANNSYKDGAKNHSVADGDWYTRKAIGVKIYNEWLPVRTPDPNDTFKIFRRFTWGNLADLHMLDTRLYDRSQQVAPQSGQQFVYTSDTTLNDSTRNMLGPSQLDWLKNNLDSSTATWQVLGQQVIMAPLVVPAGFLPEPFIINPDQWDGYPFDRERLFNHVLQNNIQNMVVLTGDIHTSWANDLALANYDTSNRQNSAGVEFVCSSITSSNELPPLVSAPLILSLAKHVRHVDLTQHGYNILDLTAQRAQNDFVYVNTITTKTFTAASTISWYANNGERFLRQGSSPSVAQNTYPALAEFPAVPTGIKNLARNISTISVQPNPFFEEVIIQFNSVVPEETSLEVYNAEGKMMLRKNLGLTNQGLNHAVFNGNNFPSGFYVVKLKGKNASVSERMIKIN